jgi:hypothetical protein
MHQADLEGTVTSVRCSQVERPKVGDKWGPSSFSQAHPPIVQHYAGEKVDRAHREEGRRAPQQRGG